MSILQQFHKCIIDFLVDNAVHEYVSAFFHRGARSLQFGRVNSDTQFASVTFFDGRADDRTKAIDRMILINDIPNLHEIGILRGELAHEFAGLIRSVDLDDGRIAQIELWTRHA